MNKNIIEFVIFSFLIFTNFPVCSQVYVNDLNDNYLIEEIDNIEDTVLIYNDVIGEIIVKYWEHKVNDVFVKNDSILLNIDKNSGEIINYDIKWSEVDSSSFGSLNDDFKINNYSWKKLVIFLNKNDCSYFYTFYEDITFPVICWEVRSCNGTTTLFDREGDKIGWGIPAPSEIGFSLNGYDEDVGPNIWQQWRENANTWFRKWCNSTSTVASPSVVSISQNISNPNVTYLYEIAHGGSTFFSPNKNDYYYSYYVNYEMRDRQPMKFAFIGSCDGMVNIDEGSFSYEFRKGQIQDTITIGYAGMAESPGWSVSLDWQDYMFSKMDEGYTIKESFDLASIQYPTIVEAVVFVGDQELKVNHKPEKPQKISGPKSGKYSISYDYNTSTTDFDGDQIFYKWDWEDDIKSNWFGPFESGEEFNISHIWNEKGLYQIRVKAKDIYDTESDWSDPLPVNIAKNRALIDIDLLRIFEFFKGRFTFSSLFFNDLEVCI